MSTSEWPRRENCLAGEHRTQRARLRCRAHWASGPSQVGREQAIETGTYRTPLARGLAAGPARDLRSPGRHDRVFGVLQSYYQAHKDDVDAWEDAVPATAPKRRLTTVVSVRFAPEELDRLRGESPGGNVSQLIRSRTLGPSLSTASEPRPTHTTLVDFTLPIAKRAPTRFTLSPTAVAGTPAPFPMELYAECR